MVMQGELDYLYGLTRLGIKPGLVVMQQLMDALDHPEQKFKSIHVTGTNGKGSTCAMMESVLREAGYSVALYTSPHLYAFNERIQINRVPISNKDLASLVQEIRQKCEVHDIHPTFFEFTTALAYLYFSRSTIDIAVVEVGMGGLYDATNVITPLVSVITNVGLDHTEYFGPTKQHVAREKAGIIKPGVPVVVGEPEEAILDLFQQKAEEHHAPFIQVRDVIDAQSISSGFIAEEVRVTSNGESYTLQLPLLGIHQIENMKVALATLNVLSAREHISISQDAIVSGIANTKWDGRLQVISHHPLVLIDGAHNGDGAHALAQFLTGIPRHDVLVFAAKQGKDISDMLTSIIPLFSHIIVTEGSFMPESADILAERIGSLDRQCTIERYPGKAYEAGRSLLQDNGTMLITGSLYMVADVLTHIRSV